MRALAFRACALVAVTAMGCGTSPPTSPGAVPTSGAATFDKKPMAGAVLLFHGPSGGPPGRAVVKPDGTFAAADPTGAAGLPEGEYAVTVEWRSGPDENGSTGPSAVPDRYARRDTTPLKVRVRPGPDGRCDLGTLALTR